MQQDLESSYAVSKVNCCSAQELGEQPVHIDTKQTDIADIIPLLKKEFFSRKLLDRFRREILIFGPRKSRLTFVCRVKTGAVTGAWSQSPQLGRHKRLCERTA